MYIELALVVYLTFIFVNRIDWIRKTMDELLKRLTAYLDQAGAEFAYLFGSFATGQAGSESDVDLAVSFPAEHVVDWAALQQGLVLLAEREVDLINLAEAELVLRYQVVSKGRLILGEKRKVQLAFEYPVITEFVQYREDSAIVRERIKERGRVWKK